MIFGQNPIFSTYSNQTDFETKRNTPTLDRIEKKTYRLLSNRSKKDPNSTYNRILRFQNSSREVQERKKQSNLRILSKTPDYSEVKSRVRFI